MADAFCAWNETADSNADPNQNLNESERCQQVDPPAITVHSFATSEVLPLSAEFLRVPVRTDQAGLEQGEIRVNGLTSACSGAAVGCNFLPDDSYTPTVVSLSPTVASVGTVVTLVGLKFPINVTAEVIAISIGHFGRCDIQNITSTSSEVDHIDYPGVQAVTVIQCTVSASTMAGDFSVTIFVEPLGRALHNYTMSVTGAISSITPNTGSLHGGTVVVIEGQGFAKFGPYNRVRIAGILCVPKTMKNMECRKDAVSMGFACTSVIEYAYGESAVAILPISE